ncbi:xaa-Pro aminopeptidase ApepP-like [Phymastichus coffea]|uniref:xaa-Pro aminopeptidase ApepP-like n=1 Tax=Phymastichus coffea TaxID=108790 RepID=UPI00273C7221|nr:xaa-Pro aminopeptidase ApepP-like [Phymastichus coffea]
MASTTSPNSICLSLLACLLLGTEISGDAQDLTEPPLNYQGSNRKFCPANEFPNQQPPERVNTTSRLRAIRSEMIRIATIQTASLDGYIVTSNDEHQSEFVAGHDERRRYITGFSGSVGNALITTNKAILWTDGRYFIQADSQMDCNWILMRQMQKNTPTLTQWLKHEYKDRNVRIGVDPKLIPASIWDSWEDDLANTSIKLIPVENNLIDVIWQVDRPEYDSRQSFPLEISFSGKPWQEKVKQIRDEMLFQNVSALVVTALDEIAWLFNIRGYDLPNTNVLRAYAVIEFGKIRLYTPKNKLSRDTEIHLKMDGCFYADCVSWAEYSDIFKDLRTFNQLWNKVWLPSRCVYSPGSSKLVNSCISEDKRLIRPSPIINLRAEKNEVEMKGMRNAHLKDAVAMCDFLGFMEQQMELGGEGWDELQVVRVVNSFRFQQKDNVGTSFETIVGYGPHGAMPHYEPSNLTNIKIGLDSTLVIDSGGQYKDGTTDITRTLHFGEPTQAQREAYTRVLMGQIELTTTVFPSNLRTDQLDVLTRKTLWSTGYDYMHGTSHGVGHFLSVHESPITVTCMGKRDPPVPGCNSALLKPGYFLSNEPGYYKEDDFGVRLENVIEVVPASVPTSWNQQFLQFRDVALVPYEPKLIETEMLSPLHRRWLNEYNKRIRDEVGAELKKQLRPTGYNWMMKKTRNIPEWGLVNLNYFRGKSDSMSNSSTMKLSSFIIVTIIVNLHLL